MSAAMGSATSLSRVYVQLLDEGVIVFRPTQAEFLSPDTARLVAPEDYDPECEDWEFKPGSFVRVEPRHISEGQVLVAVEIVSLV